LVAESFNTQGPTTRQCICCGIPAATRSIPACWEHWNLLSADLRSSLVRSYGLGQLTQYANCLLEAVSLWRQVGAWRHKRGDTNLPVVKSSTLNSHMERKVIERKLIERKVIQLAGRRRTFVLPSPGRSDSSFNLDKPLSKAR